MSYTIGQIMQMRQGLGGLFGQPQMGFDPRMLDSITEPIVRFYGQEKMGPFRQELIGLIKETFPDFVEGGIMGAIQPYGGLSKPAYTMGGGSFHSDEPMGKPALATDVTSGGYNYVPKSGFGGDPNAPKMNYTYEDIKNAFTQQEPNSSFGNSIKGLGSIFNTGYI